MAFAPIGFAPISLSLPTHAKIMAAGVQGPAVLGWQTAAICFSNLHLTDGVLRRSQLAALLPGAGPPDEQVLTLLLDLRLWDEISPGVWRIHDFGDENVLRAERDEARAADAARKRAAYRAKRSLRSEKKKSPSEKKTSPLEKTVREEKRRHEMRREEKPPPTPPRPFAALAEAIRPERSSRSLVQNQDSPEAVLNQDGQEDPMHPWETRADAVKAQLDHRAASGLDHEPANCPTCAAAKAEFAAATASNKYLSQAAAAYLARCRDRLLAQRGSDNGTDPTQIPSLEP
jgi:hypothetical protein